MQTASFVTVTLFKDGQRVAGFGAAHDLPREWTQTDIDLVRDVARAHLGRRRARARRVLRSASRTSRLRLALEASAGGSWSWIAATNQVDWDDRCQRPVRSSTTMSRPKPTRGCHVVHDEDRPRMRAAMQEMMSSTDRDLVGAHVPGRETRRHGALGAEPRPAPTAMTTDASCSSLVSTSTSTATAAWRRPRARSVTRNTIARCAHCSRPPRRASCRCDAGGVIVSANQAFEAMFGWPPGELIAQHGRSNDAAGVS
jgi:PAS domain-containing protein